MCGDYWDFDAELEASLARVFLPPPLRDWQLAIGGWVGGQEGNGRLEGVAHICRSLSERYGRVYAFTSQGRRDFYAWILAENGSVWRHFVWDGGVVVDAGSPLAIERTSARSSVSDKPRLVEPSEDLVAAIAGELSLNPLTLDVSQHHATPGWLATTAWGREHGRPSRSRD